MRIAVGTVVISFTDIWVIYLSYESLLSTNFMKEGDYIIKYVSYVMFFFIM